MLAISPKITLASVKMTELNNLKSVIKLKNSIVASLPYAPRDKDSKEYLLSLDVGDLIHIYDFWQQRLIPSRPRKVLVGNKVRNSTQYIRNRRKIGVLLDRVRNGDDISGYLSQKAHCATFDVNEFKSTRSFNSFRDQILVCEGFYHLHLDEFPARTDEILIVHVTLREFEIVQVAMHSLFENDNEARVEYARYVDEFLSSKMPGGGLIIGGAGGGMQNLSGSSIFSSLNQIDMIKKIQNVELRNGGIESYTRKLYAYLHKRNTQYVKPEWRLVGRELTIYDKKNKKHFSEQNLAYIF